MRTYFLTGLAIIVGVAVAAAGVRPASASSRGRIKSEDRPARAREALHPATDAKARFNAVHALTISGYCVESTRALGTIAADAKYKRTTRGYAAMGLWNFTSYIPMDARQTIQSKLLVALKTEQDKMPDSIIRTLIAWGNADKVREVLRETLHGHSMEIEVLQDITSHDQAVKELLRIYKSAPAVTTKAGWTKRWHVGAALIHRKNERGIDILMQCLTVEKPWPIDNASPRAKRSNTASFRQSLANTFERIARILDEDFGYEPRGRWTPRLAQTIPTMAAWWRANRQTWSFKKATSTAIPKLQKGTPLTKRQARVLAAKLANEAFAAPRFQRVLGKPARKIKITPEWFNYVWQENGRWILKKVASAGPEGSISFNLDGFDATVNVHYSLR